MIKQHHRNILITVTVILSFLSILCFFLMNYQRDLSFINNIYYYQIKNCDFQSEVDEKLEKHSNTELELFLLSKNKSIYNNAILNLKSVDQEVLTQLCNNIRPSNQLTIFQRSDFLRLFKKANLSEENIRKIILLDESFFTFCLLSETNLSVDSILFLIEKASDDYSSVDLNDESISTKILSQLDSKKLSPDDLSTLHSYNIPYLNDLE